MEKWKEIYGDYRYTKFENMKLITVTPRYHRKFYKRDGVEFYKRILKNSIKLFSIFVVIGITYITITSGFTWMIEDLRNFLKTDIISLVKFYLSTIWLAFVYEFLLKYLSKNRSPRVLGSEKWKKPIVSYLMGRGLFYRRSYEVQTRTKQSKIMYDELKMLGLRFEEQIKYNNSHAYRLTYTTTLTNAIFQEKQIIKQLEKLFSNK